MIFRPYAAADRVECLRLFRSNVPRYFTVPEEGDFARWLDQMDGLLPTPPGDVVEYGVIGGGDGLLACGGWGIRAGEQHATLIWGMVDAACHGRGIGRALTEHRLTAFDAAFPGCPIRIDTSHHTAPFYARFGFDPLRITPDGYAPGLHRWDMERPARAR